MKRPLVLAAVLAATVLLPLPGGGAPVSNTTAATTTAPTDTTADAQAPPPTSPTTATTTPTTTAVGGGGATLRLWVPLALAELTPPQQAQLPCVLLYQLSGRGPADPPPPPMLDLANSSRAQHSLELVPTSGATCAAAPANATLCTAPPSAAADPTPASLCPALSAMHVVDPSVALSFEVQTADTALAAAAAGGRLYMALPWLMPQLLQASTTPIVLPTASSASDHAAGLRGAPLAGVVVAAVVALALLTTATVLGCRRRRCGGAHPCGRKGELPLTEDPAAQQRCGPSWGWTTCWLCCSRRRRQALEQRQLAALGIFSPTAPPLPLAARGTAAARLAEAEDVQSFAAAMLSPAVGPGAAPRRNPALLRFSSLESPTSFDNPYFQARDISLMPYGRRVLDTDVQSVASLEI